MCSAAQDAVNMLRWECETIERLHIADRRPLLDVLKTSDLKNRVARAINMSERVIEMAQEADPVAYIAMNETEADKEAGVPF